MRSVFLTLATLLLAGSVAATATAQTGAASAAPAGVGAAPPVTKRGPVFRANREQITQAQTLLKQQGHYSGEATGKLDPETRAALKKYQTAAGLKPTGTLNRATLEKMSITLTDKQKAI